MGENWWQKDNKYWRENEWENSEPWLGWTYCELCQIYFPQPFSLPLGARFTRLLLCMCDLGGWSRKGSWEAGRMKKGWWGFGGSFVYVFTTKTRLSTCGPNSSSQTLPSEQSRLNTSAYRPGFPQSSTYVSSVIVHHCIVFIRKEVTGLGWG